VWDVGANAGARKALSSKLAEAGRAVKERTSGGVIGVASDDEDSSGDEIDD
jgi:periodic tryptophan protein 1